MRKIVLLMHVSLDGFVADTNGGMGWIKLDDKLFDYVTTITDEADVALYGAHTYPMMEEYWPTAATQPGASSHDIEHSKWANQSLKLVFSTTIRETHWDNTRIISKNIEQEMADLKSQPGKNLLMLGSPTLARSFMKMGLIDEFYLNVNPVVLGGGIPLFSDTPINLVLKDSQVFETGVVSLHYAKEEAFGAASR